MLRKFLIVAGVVALTAFGVACSGDDDEPNPTATTAAAATATSASGTTGATGATGATGSTGAAVTPTRAPASGTITLYSGRAEALVAPLIQQFTRDTGINVEVRYGGSAAMAAQIAEEGNNTPADVFWPQDPGPLGFLSDRFAEIPDDILERVDEGFRSPDGKWVGVSGRVRVVVYNPDLVQESDLPDSLQDLTDPRWQGKIGWAPTNGSFQIMVTAMRKLEGEDAARDWLQAVKDNGAQVYGNNNAVLQAVAAGEVEIGVINHYYLHAARRTTPDIKAENHYLNNDEAGALIMVSGTGILSTTDNMAAAQALVDYLLSPAAQQYFATQTAEYPLIEGVITPPNLTPLDDLTGPEIDLADLDDLAGTLELLRETGLVQ